MSGGKYCMRIADQAIALLVILVGSANGQEVGDATVEQTLPQRMAAARELQTLPAGPARGFKLTGTITFHIQGNPPKPRGCEVWLGGHGRLRYRLGTAWDAHVFLLRDHKTAWIKPQNKDNFEDTEARQLGLQNWMRWTVTTLPRGLEGILGEFPADTTELNLTSPFGTIKLILDTNSLPLTMSHRELSLKVADWKAGGTGELIPHTWEWEDEYSLQVEKFEEIIDRVLLYDRSFFPPHADGSTTGYSQRTGAAGSSFVGEEFGIITLNGWRTTPAAPLLGELQQYIKNGSVGGLRWYFFTKELVGYSWLVVTDKSKLPPKSEINELPGGLFLRWVTLADNPIDQDIAVMSKTARDNKLEIIGQARVTGHRADNRGGRRELLLPIKMPE